MPLLFTLVQLLLFLVLRVPLIASALYLLWLVARWLDRPKSKTDKAGLVEPMSALGVRRGKAALSSGCKSHPATAPAGSNRSSHGGNEMAEAFG